MPAFQQAPPSRSERINFRMTPHEYELLIQRAAERNVDIVTIVREALEQYFSSDPANGSAKPAKARKPAKRA
jgi:predicted DNA binding CopG/RHH family protein